MAKFVGAVEAAAESVVFVGAEVDEGTLVERAPARQALYLRYTRDLAGHDDSGVLQREHDIGDGAQAQLPDAAAFRCGLFDVGVGVDSAGREIQLPLGVVDAHDHLFLRSPATPDDVLDDLKAAWRWTQEAEEPQVAERLLTAVCWWAYWRLRADVLCWGAQLVADHPTTAPPVAYTTAAACAWLEGDFEEAERWKEPRTLEAFSAA